MGENSQPSEPQGSSQPPAGFVFELAGPDDDASLRAILAATPTPGRIAICFQREPSFLGASVVEGRFRQTIVARDCRLGGRIVGLGSRNVSPAFVNGRQQAVGYLSGLRLLPQYRGGTLIARGYRYFGRLHQDGRTPLYLTTIADGNLPALRALTGGRAGMPAYHDAGRYHTFLLPRRWRSGPGPGAGVRVRLAEAEELPGLLEFWRRVGPRRQFFPALSEQDFEHAQALYRDLAPARILTAWRGSTLCGTLALWSQQAFRQTVVTGLPGWLRCSRPLYNAWSAAAGRPPLPQVGRAVSYLMAALIVIADDDRLVMQQLLAWARSREFFPDERFLAVGLHERDPLSRVPKRWSLRYDTRLFLVCWEDGEPYRQALDQRPPYLELGRL